MSNEWDYLSRVTIGQFLPLPYPIHRMDVRLRILLFIFLLACVTIAHTPLMLGIMVLVTILVLLISRVPVKFVLKGLLPPLPFILILAVIQIVFNASADSAPIFLQIHTWQLSLNDLFIGLTLVIRFGCLIILLSLSSLCISTTDLIKGLGALLKPLAFLHFPVRDAVMVIQITLRFIPFLALSAERIAKAQASRGAVWGKGSGGLFSRARQFIPLLVPLFLTSLQKAEVTALAMDARGYRSTGKNPPLEKKKIQPLEIAAVCAALGFVVLAVLF